MFRFFNWKKGRILRIKILVVFILTNIISAQSIVNSVHNLSVSGPGSVIATSEDEVCVFCHTPHNSSPRQPLWNRSDPALNYSLYPQKPLYVLGFLHLNATMIHKVSKKGKKSKVFDSTRFLKKMINH